MKLSEVFYEMEPQTDDAAPLLPIPDWMKAKARGVSTNNVNWSKPSVYYGHPLRQSQSQSVLKPPAKLVPLHESNQHDSIQDVCASPPPSIRKSGSVPPLSRPATPPPSMQHLVPTPTALPTFVTDTSRTMTPPHLASSMENRFRTSTPLIRASTPELSSASSDKSPLFTMPLRQSYDLNKTNKWRARAIANPFAKRKPPVAQNNETPEPQSIVKPTPVVKKSTFRMVQPPTNQDDVDPSSATASSTSEEATPPTMPTYGKVQRTPPKQVINEVKRSPAPSPTKWEPEPMEPPRPKEKQQPKRPKGKATSCVGALAEIQRKRDERRALQAQEKQRKDDELKQHGDDTGYKFRRLIRAYRDALTPSRDVRKPTSTSSKLSVFVRKRPLSKKELHHKGYDVITCTRPSELICHEPKFKVDMSTGLENHTFSFDGVFDDNVDNNTVYSASVGPLIPLLLDQGILTVFAYGQTGSGKTYTMKSVYRQAAADLFAQLGANKAALTVGVSFYDIYKNGVCDLLNGRKKVQALEDNEGVVQLVGVTETTITSDAMLTDLVEQGEAARITSINGVHDDSSRSHAILRVTLYSGGTARGRLSMVDLAGSERACETQTDDKSTRMEGAEINKSLLALKECIRAMDVGAKHLPFRQSKLTQILRDSFMSETSRTVMIATVSPCSEHSNHTLNTLRYADRLKEINGRDAN
ncbi:hypothetical protein LEN26_014353 [Aphanomyces euteiches]|nr:hypothetical protein LEN26_014353 [Aphanomyces euteiches]